MNKKIESRENKEIFKQRRVRKTVNSRKTLYWPEKKWFANL
jgi:hypothetical protein